MTVTGWTGEPPETAALPLTGRLLAMKQDAASPLETALARSRADEVREPREAAAAMPDPDEHAAAMVARGYLPGQLGELSRRLADTTAELETERAKLEKSARRRERVARDHQAGRISVADIVRMGDLDDGDEATVQRMERRAASIRRQIAEASAMAAPQRQADELVMDATLGRAHGEFVSATRARMAAARAGRPARRPFGGGAAVRSAEAIRSESCVHCVEAGVSDEISFLLHLDPELAVPVTPPEQAAPPQIGRAAAVPMIYR